MFEMINLATWSISKVTIFQSEQLPEVTHFPILRSSQCEQINFEMNNFPK